MFFCFFHSSFLSYLPLFTTNVFNLEWQRMLTSYTVRMELRAPPALRCLYEAESVLGTWYSSRSLLTGKMEDMAYRFQNFFLAPAVVLGWLFI